MNPRVFLSLALILSGLYVSHAQLTNGLVAYYPFEGNADDASGNGWHGSNYTGVVQYLDGKYGQGAYFDGSSCIHLPQARLLDGESNATLCVWVRLAGEGGGQILAAGDGRAGMDPITTRIKSETAEDVKFVEVVNNSQAILGFDNGDPMRGLGGGYWHLFTMILERQSNQSVFRSYVDGTVVKRATNANFSRIAYDVDMPALVGALDASSPGQFFRGTLDELRIYNRALSHGEVTYLALGGDPRVDISVLQVQVCWNASNKFSQLQYKSDITSGNWVDFGPVFTNLESRICVPAEVDEPNKCFRVRFLP
jgi:hypothetical protein